MKMPVIEDKLIVSLDQLQKRLESAYVTTPEDLIMLIGICRAITEALDKRNKK